MQHATGAPPLLSLEDRIEMGLQARKVTPRRAHAELDLAGRPDPVALLAEQDATRLSWLVPERHARMAVSPFTFFRGAARVMAADLAGTPSTGLSAQVCGDAHLSNFGVYGAPDRSLVFDANDFDETLAGPWEWDLKRLAASLTIAAGHRCFGSAAAQRITASSVRAYRGAMADFASRRTLDVWYDRLSAAEFAKVIGVTTAAERKQLASFEAAAVARDSRRALRKLAVEVDGHYRIRSLPPVLVPLRDLTDDERPDDVEEAVRVTLDAYSETLSDHQRLLLRRFRPVDAAVKAVGVGSVGTHCFVALLEGRDRDDPLFLQLKEAGPSVLEEHLGPSPYSEHGRRVVEGQRLMQSTSDIFLGWTRGPRGRHYYVRQLHDWKGSANVEGMPPERMEHYAGVCGRVLARGHARSGDPVAISAYLGRGEAMDRALCVFADQYARQNAADHAAFAEAIRSGALTTSAG